MKGIKLYTIPKINAPSPNGILKKSNKATVASVRTRILTHIGRINSTTKVLERFNLALLRIQAAGYPKRIQISVVMIAIPMEYTKVLIASW